MDALQRISGLQDVADALHRYALAEVNKLMDAEAGSPRVAALSELAEIVQAYETRRFQQ